MSFLTGLLTPFQWTAIGVFVVAMLVINRQSVAAMFSGWKLPSIGTTEKDKAGIPTRRELLDYLTASYAYFESEGCKEGMEAIGTAVEHAFHEHDEAGNTTTAKKK